MYCFDECNHILDRCLRQDTVTEIEDVAGPSTGLCENFANVSAKVVQACKQIDRIEIAHYTDIEPNALPSFIQRYAPIQSNHIAAGLTHQLK